MGAARGVLPGTTRGFPVAAVSERLAATESIPAGDLTVGFATAGPQDGTAVLLLHGWPYDIQSFAEVTPILANAGYRVVVPYLRGYGTTRFRSSSTQRNGQPAAFARDAIALLDALGIDRAIVGGFDWGARTANALAALWPERCRGQVSVSGYLLASQAANALPLPPASELRWWYQFYFATDRGRVGYEQNRREFAHLIWSTASPQWHFTEETFARTATSFDNPDHVDIVVSNYRWRLGLDRGEARFDDIEKQLALRPAIEVPTITMEGDANGAAHPEPSAYRSQFTGAYEHRDLSGGVGHNLPQEAPAAFAEAVLAVDRSAVHAGWHIAPLSAW
jgi:pimeloyl-ACP methyl ester carboxylesterase